MEPGFTIGHEFVGTVTAVGDDVTRVKPGDRVLGCYHSACGTCFFCMRGAYHKCDHARVFGHGELLGALPGTQADAALVPMADLALRAVPAGVTDDVALFAGDVMGTGYHAVTESGVQAGDSVAVLGLGPVGCARSRSRSPPAPARCSRSTRCPRASRSPAASGRSRSICTRRARVTSLVR